MEKTKPSMSDILAKHLECPICLERLKEPKALYCMHTFCKSCVEQIVENRHRKMITCPTCRYVTKVNSVQSLRPNYIAECVMQAIDDEIAAEKKRQAKLKKQTDAFIKKVYGKSPNELKLRKHASDSAASAKFSPVMDIDHFNFKNPSFAAHVNHRDVVFGIKSHTAPSLFQFKHYHDNGSIEQAKAQFFQLPSECKGQSTDIKTFPKEKITHISKPIDFDKMARSIQLQKINWFSGETPKGTSNCKDAVRDWNSKSFSISDQIDKARLMIMSIELNTDVKLLHNYFNELNIKTSELLDYQQQLFEAETESSDSYSNFPIFKDSMEYNTNLWPDFPLKAFPSPHYKQIDSSSSFNDSGINVSFLESESLECSISSSYKKIIPSKKSSKRSDFLRRWKVKH